jgi:5-methylcytosine-specific restriction endonuclease McrA
MIKPAKIPLKTLVKDQGGCCHYCKVLLTVGDTRVKKDTDATVEHLVDKWSSPNHIKNNERSNLVAACYKCNNTLGNLRNRIARTYYQGLIDKAKTSIRAANIPSARLYKMFGPVPQNLFKA